jgi:hypothetical protein
MQKAKEKAAAPVQAAPEPQHEQEQKPPEKQFGRLQLARSQAATGSLPPPDGSPSLARAGALVGTQFSGIDTSHRAGMANTIQRQAGNIRMGSMGSAGTQSKKASGLIHRSVQRSSSYTSFQSTPKLGRKTSIQRKCACGGEAGPDGECAQCKARRESIQRQASGFSSTDNIPSSVTTAIRSRNGQSLSRSTREPMEQSFGADFSGVRVHTGEQASQAAQDINATAFTHGQDIYFGDGKFQPSSSEGQKLLAHELTHTIQQKDSEGVQASLTHSVTISQPGDSQEREAESIAQMVSRDIPATKADFTLPSSHSFQRQVTLPATAAATDAVTVVSQAIKNGDVSAAVRPLRQKSIGELQSIRTLVHTGANIWLEKWFVTQLNRSKMAQKGLNVLGMFGAILSPGLALLGTTASLEHGSGTGTDGIAEEGLRLLLPTLPLLDHLEIYDVGYREIEQAQLDIIRSATADERAAARAEPKRLEVIYANMDIKEEYEARLLIDPKNKYTAAERLLKRAPGGILPDKEDLVFDAIWALTPTERKTFYKKKEGPLKDLLSEDRFNLLGTLVEGTEAAALIARLREATEGRIDDQEAVQAVVERAVSLLAEEKYLNVSLAELPPEEKSKAQDRLMELGELKTLLDFGTKKLDPKGFLGRLVGAADSPEAFGAMAQKLGATINDPAEQAEFAFRTAKQRVLMAAGITGANEDSIRNAILELRAPPISNPIKLPPLIREQKQAEANAKLRLRLLDDKEVQDIINTMPTSAGRRVRSFVNADPFVEKLTDLTLALNSARWGEFFQIVLEIALRDDWKARFEDSSKSPFETYARVHGKQRSIMLDILKNKRIPTTEILGFTGNVEVLRTTLANIDEAERGQLRVGYLLTRSGRKPADKTEQEALEAYKTFEGNLRKSQTTLSTDTSGIEAVLDAALGAEPTAKEMETDEGKYNAAALMYERQQARLALRRGVSEHFTETDETMEAAAREFAALWLQLRDRIPHKLSTVELAALSTLHDRFNKRSEEFTEASNTAGEVAGMIAATLAGIIIVAGTGGLTAPAVIAAAAAGGTARVVTREMFGDDYYNPTGGVAARDALLGGIDAALAVLGTALGTRGVELLGLGGKAFLTNAAHIAGEVAEQASTKLLHRVAAGAVEAAIDGAFSSFVSEAMNAMTDARTWRRGVWKGLLQVGQAALIAGLSGLAAGGVLGAALPVVGAGLRSAADRLVGTSVERALAKASQTETLEAARSAIRAGNKAEAERLFAQLEKYLSAEQANLLWRDLARLTESLTRLEEPITLLGQRHTLKLVQGERGAFFVLCSWCTRVRTILEQSLNKVTEGSNAAKRLRRMIEQLEKMEANIAEGVISKKQAENINTMKSLLGMLTEGEHLIGATLEELPRRGSPNFSKLASDPAVARRAEELYEGYLEQLWASRREIFKGRAIREDLTKALEEEAQARALVQAQRESPRGAPLELMPGEPARTSVDPRVDIPYGFYDRASFEAFSRRLNAALEARASNSKLVMEGSGVTGRRFERLVEFKSTGSPFGLGRMSDYDIAIISDSLFAEAQRLRISMQGGEVASTLPLQPADIAKLKLSNVDAAAQSAIRDATGMAHPVNFKIRPSSAPEATVNLPLP